MILKMFNLIHCQAWCITYGQRCHCDLQKDETISIMKYKTYFFFRIIKIEYLTKVVPILRKHCNSAPA